MFIEVDCIFKLADVLEWKKTVHKLSDIEKLFKVPEEICDIENGEVGATNLKILRS